MWITRRVDKNTSVTYSVTGIACLAGIVGFFLIALLMQLAKIPLFVWGTLAAVGAVFGLAVWLMTRPTKKDRQDKL